MNTASAKTFLLGAACVAGAVALSIGAGSARAAAAKPKLTIYSVITQAQFLNNADDRQRAIINNPFTTNTAKLMKVMKGVEANTGPLPGDTALFSYTLYKNASLKEKIGTAVYNCDYLWEGKGRCSAYFEFNGGVLMASGQIFYKDTKLTLSVRGGTYDYLGSRGQLKDVPVAGSQTARHVTFTFLG